MKRYLVLLFGVFTYISFHGVFLYSMGFVGNFLVPKSLDGVAQMAPATAIAINVLLLGLFAVQHSVMARPWFKRWWTRFIPEPIERSTYVLCTNIVLAILFWQWQPMGGIVWDVQHGVGRMALHGLSAAGWLTVLATTFLLNHFDLFGLRQVRMYFRGQPYTSLKFATPGPYKIVRHPMYIGWLAAFWGTPTMTVAHLAFALGITVYILTAIYFEERDLVRSLGIAYADYRRTVPMLIPRVVTRSPPSANVTNPRTSGMMEASAESSANLG